MFIILLVLHLTFYYPPIYRYILIFKKIADESIIAAFLRTFSLLFSVKLLQTETQLCKIFCGVSDSDVSEN